MKRAKLRDRRLPDYTRGEEIFNMVSHIAGGGVGVFAAALCIVKAFLTGDAYDVVGAFIYGISMVVLYAMSSLYHGLKPVMAKKVFQILDHVSIYWLIAGTYTPVLICAMAKKYPVEACVTFAIVWGLAILATVLTAIDLRKYRVFSMICYVGMGWAIIFSAKQAYLSLGRGGFLWILLGGILYTAGVFFFVRRVRYFHSVFHIFVVLGSLCHSVAVIFYVL